MVLPIDWTELDCDPLRSADTSGIFTIDSVEGEWGGEAYKLTMYTGEDELQLGHEYKTFNEAADVAQRIVELFL